MSPLTETPKKKNWFRRDVSPGFQKFVNVTAYGMGRASAQLKAKKSEFVEKHRVFNEEVKAFNKTVVGDDQKKRQKRMAWMDITWIWFSGFSKGVSMRLAQLKVEKPVSTPVPQMEVK